MRKASLKRFYKEHFAAKVFAAFAILMFAISLSFTAFFINRQGTSMRSDLLTKGVLLSRLLAYNSRIGVFSENKDLLQDPIIGIVQQEDVLKVSLYNGKGELLAAQEKSGTKMPLIVQDNEKASKEDIVKQVKGRGSAYTVDYNDCLDLWCPVVSQSSYPVDSLFFNVGASREKEEVIGFARIIIDKRPLFDKLDRLLITAA